VKDFQVGEEKIKIRRSILQKRNKIGIKSRKDKSIEISRRVRGLSGYKKAKVVMFYANIGSEVITDYMISNAIDDGKKVVLPVSDITKGTICAHRVSGTGTDCKRSAFGIREPDTKKCRPVYPGDIDLVIIPGVAFDTSGVRLGFGKGFYDRWLKKFKKSKRIGLCFESQLVKRLPFAKHDTRVGSIVTEKRSVKTKPAMDTKGASTNV
jgi:5-formyltetrahydrofolate cyclo-ligase